MADQQNSQNPANPLGQNPSGGQSSQSAQGRQGFSASNQQSQQSGAFPLGGALPGGVFPPSPPPYFGGDFPGAAGQPGGGFPGAGFPPPPPPQPEDTTPANFQIGSKLPKVISVKVSPHQLQFDEQYFLHLLAGSISLTRDEKVRIVDSIPKLKQSQVDELIRIFEEERKKFAELPAKHAEQLKKLEAQHYSDWMDIELKQKQSGKKSEDEAKAEAIRKQLGLN